MLALTCTVATALLAALLVTLVTASPSDDSQQHQQRVQVRDQKSKPFIRSIDIKKLPNFATKLTSIIKSRSSSSQKQYINLKTQFNSLKSTKTKSSLSTSIEQTDSTSSSAELQPKGYTLDPCVSHKDCIGDRVCVRPDLVTTCGVSTTCLCMSQEIQLCDSCTECIQYPEESCIISKSGGSKGICISVYTVFEGITSETDCDSFPDIIPFPSSSDGPLLKPPTIEELPDIAQNSGITQNTMTSSISPVPVATNGRTTRCPAVKKCLSTSVTCDILPVPKLAELPRLEGPTFVRQLRKNVYVYGDSAYLSLIIYSPVRKRMVLIDQPDSNSGSNKDNGSRTRITDAMLQILKGDKPSRIDFIYSHAHFDHIGASRLVFQWIKRVFRETKVIIYGTSDVRELIKNSVSKRAVLPNIIIKPGPQRVLKIENGLEISLRITGGHSGQDVLIYLVPTKTQPGIAMLVDVVIPKWTPFTSLAVTDSATSYLKAHNALLNLDYKFFIGGHLQVGNKDDVSQTLRYVRSVIQEARKSRTSVTAEQRAQVGFNNILTPNTDEYRNIWFAAINAGSDLEAKNCEREIIKKWGCELGGVASTAYSHCFAIGAYLRLET